MPGKTSLSSMSLQYSSDFRHVKECHYTGSWRRGIILAWVSGRWHLCGVQKALWTEVPTKAELRVQASGAVNQQNSEVMSAGYKELPGLAFPHGLFSRQKAPSQPQEPHIWMRTIICNWSFIYWIGMCDCTDSSGKAIRKSSQMTLRACTVSSEGYRPWLCCYGNKWFSSSLVQHRP